MNVRLMIAAMFAAHDPDPAHDAEGEAEWALAEADALIAMEARTRHAKVDDIRLTWAGGDAVGGPVDEREVPSIDPSLAQWWCGKCAEAVYRDEECPQCGGRWASKPDPLTDLGWCQQMLAESMTALDACVAALESTEVAKPDSGPAQVQWSDALKLAYKAIDRFSGNEMAEPQDKPLAGMVLAAKWSMSHDAAMLHLVGTNGAGAFACRSFWHVFGAEYELLCSGDCNSIEDGMVQSLDAAHSLGAIGGPSD